MWPWANNGLDKHARDIRHPDIYWRPARTINALDTCCTKAQQVENVLNMHHASNTFKFIVC